MPAKTNGMAKEDPHTALHTEEVQELLGTPPSWIVRWGTTLIVVAILALLAVGWWVKYPELVRAPVSLTTEMPPVPLVAPANGYIQQWFVEENERVRQDAPLGLLANPARYEDVLQLEENLALIQPFRPETYAAFDLSYPYVLGELQEAYSEFANRLRQYGPEAERMNPAGDEVPRLQERIRQLREGIRQDEKRKEDANFTYQTRLQAYKGLQQQYALNEISLLELQNYRAELSEAQYRVSNIESEIEEKKRTIAFLNEQIRQLRNGDRTDASEYQEGIDQARKSLYARLEIWKGKYLLVAPIAGLVSTFNRELRENHFVSAGETLLVILPQGEEKIIAIVELPLEQAAKIATGQSAWITLAGFPSHEYGKISGRVSYKARLPRGTVVLAEVALPNGLTTTRGQTIRFEQQMVGTAEIVTREKRLFERILESFSF